MPIHGGFHGSHKKERREMTDSGDKSRNRTENKEVKNEENYCLHSILSCTEFIVNCTTPTARQITRNKISLGKPSKDSSPPDFSSGRALEGHFD